VKLMKNFERPYFAKSIADFWRRWHISLSSWFRDYLYIPLGGNRVSAPRWYFNFLAVFTLCGLWHGASWTFVIWGALHGFYMAFGAMTKKLRDDLARVAGLNKFPRLHSLIQIAATFVLVNIGWIFFRANSLSDALYVLTHLFAGISLNLSKVYIYIGIGWAELIIMFLAICLMEIIHWLQEKQIGIINLLSNRPVLMRWSAYLAIIMMILLFGSFSGVNFIYFQF